MPARREACNGPRTVHCRGKVTCQSICDSNSGKAETCQLVSTGRHSRYGNDRRVLTVSNSKRYASGVVLALWVAMASAEELPHSSILKRYGVTPDQLPAGQPAPEVKEEPAPSRFHVQPEQPWAQVRLGDDKRPDTTGNISIDNAEARERERCQQVRNELSRRGKPLGIFCEPGQGPFPWSH
ncbi:hypothetical protein PFLCHA0_c32310 [Pseudomonas protegens CHA0]|uniref:Uncharacterized protein n=1 Tax=Pseudomonas protegens (strain DSM 19095 / LMG 27888 / CFBP 6595 / CHA0) TaxID=1124983 RepID=A0A2C9EN05_PSEPH|nr:hypothetical protein PFLCHA0_c32310 [Pseudomonas protegens CHA0]